jgi:predicted Zn-dependent protease
VLTQTVKTLDPPDSHHLRAAQGWLELGNLREAVEELDKIDASLRGHPEVLERRWQIYAIAGEWNLAAEIASELVQIRPEEPQFWISHAYAIRRMTGGGIPQAARILGTARKLFPDEPLIAYNLACYDCQLGNETGAREWLKTAFAARNAKALKAMALQDPDLEPLWNEIAKL